MARSPGATLQTADGSYRIHEVVAVGGFASVYFGRDLRTNVPVAVKILHPHHVSNERVVRLFLHEAVLARGLSHPNVVGVLDQGQADDGQPFIVMEWMTGWTIGALIADRGAFDPGEAAFVAGETLKALTAAHNRRIYHRDIKPANLMLTAEGVVKVMDFGISKDASLAAATGASGFLGTPAYMAPEQFRGEVADGRTDLYALGVTLYQMLAGKVPFESTTTHGYMYLHLEQPPRALRELRPDLPPLLEKIVLIALEKTRERRFQSAEAMAAALASFSAGRVALPSRPPDGTVIAQMSTPSSPSVSPVQPYARSGHVAEPAGAPAEPAPDSYGSPPPAAPAQSRQVFDAGPSAPSHAHAPEPIAYGGTPVPAGGWSGSPTPTAHPPTSSPTRPSVVPWLLLAVAVALVVFGGLVGAYWFLADSFSTRQATVTPTQAPNAVDVAPKPPAAAQSAASASPAQPGPTVAGCSTGLTTAANQRQLRDLAAAATTLEGLRSSGCDVTEPLYEAFLEHGRELADAERTDEAVTRFDQALQVKSTDDARLARSLAAAYRDGRGAIDRRSWDEAVQKLDLVHRSSPAYARGKIVAHLKAALIGKGDELRRQARPDEALESYQRAQTLGSDDPEIAARVRDAEAERDRRRAAEAAAHEPTATPAPPPPSTTTPTTIPVPASMPADLERVAHAYYAALNARRFDEAYALLSARARQQQTLDQFRARFTNTLGIRVREIVNTSVQGQSGTLTVRTETRNATPQGEQLACSRVGWTLIYEAQSWRRDIVSGSGNEQGERC